MLQTYLLVATTILTLSQSFGYSPNAKGGSAPSTIHDQLTSTSPVTSGTRRQLLAQVAVVAATGTNMLIGNEPALAAEESETIGVSPSPLTTSIEKCSTNSKAPCVSTANVRNLDLYLPPWTFDRSPDEVMSRLKGSIVADSSCQIVQQNGNQYLKVEAKRNDLFATVDELEFVVNGKDQVVFFRSRASNNENPDFGINKKRLEEIRKRAGIFGVMGEFMNSADSASVDQRGNGPLGQLKAFYGLQSGGGFEDVVLE